MTDKKRTKNRSVKEVSESHDDLTMLAYNGIQNLLFRNEIAPGQQLNSRWLGQQLNMSPTPVIQALKLLHFQGLLTHIPKKGYFLERNSKETVRDIFNLRLVLELASLDNILERIDESGWQRLETAIEAHMEALEKNIPKSILLADMAFHITLAEISTGPVGERLIRYLFEMLYLKNRPMVLYISPKLQFGRHHQEILMHLRNKDIESARQTLTEHILQVRDKLIESLCRDDEDLKVNW